MLTALALSLLLTVLLEEGFALAWGLRGRDELALVALVNCLTNPPVVLLRYTAVTLRGWPVVPVTAALEISAILVEAYCYRRGSRALKRPLLFAVLANLFSYTAGAALQILR